MILYQLLSYDKLSITKASLKPIHTSTTALGPNHLPSMLQCITGSLPGVLSSQGRKLTIHLHLLMRLQMWVPIQPLAHVLMMWYLIKHATLPSPSCKGSQLPSYLHTVSQKNLTIFKLQ